MNFGFTSDPVKPIYSYLVPKSEIKLVRVIAISHEFLV